MTTLEQSPTGVTPTPLPADIVLVRLGWLGIGADGTPVLGAEEWTSVAGQAGILLVWALLGALIVREHFRWEPRG